MMAHSPVNGSILDVRAPLRCVRWLGRRIIVIIMAHRVIKIYDIDLLSQCDREGNYTSLRQNGKRVLSDVQ